MPFRRPRRSTGPDRPSRVGQPATALEGVDPAGRPVAVDPEGRTVYFLTSSCQPCQVVWPTVGDRSVLVVTPDPSTESRRKVAELAPDGATVVMSSEAWFAYAAGPAPWKVTVSGGVVVSEGPALPQAPKP